MPSDIHPSAMIHPDAVIGENLKVGPYSIIDPHVRIGNDCRIGPHVYLTGHTTIGNENVFHSGAVIGDSPQDISYKDAPTRTKIGDRNTFREHVTIHRSTSETEATTIGSDNFFMASSHAGHNSHIGNRNVLANGALIAGHAIIEDQITFGGNAGVHQFSRIGRLAFLQGNSGVSQDLPPFLINSRINEVSGLNMIGMRRAGISSVDRIEMKKLYHLFFREGNSTSESMEKASDQFKSACCQEFLEFVKGSKRGICSKLRE
jgi:UDP-N-acetylglucosamine acyltransferase